MAESSERVCPRCGHAADGDAFCPECGFDLKGAGELPTRAEWLQSRQEPATGAAQPAAAAPGAPPPPPAAPAQAAPSPGGPGPISQSTVVPVVILLVGAALAIFGIVRIVSGDSEVGKLEDERDSLQSQKQSLVSSRTAIEKSGQETDKALSAFIQGAETVGEQWEAAVESVNTIIGSLNAGAAPPGFALQEGRETTVALGKGVDEAQQLLGATGKALIKLEKSNDLAEQQKQEGPGE